MVKSAAIAVATFVQLFALSHAFSDGFCESVCYYSNAACWICRGFHSDNGI